MANRKSALFGLVLCLASLVRADRFCFTTDSSGDVVIPAEASSNVRESDFEIQTDENRTYISWEGPNYYNYVPAPFLSYRFDCGAGGLRRLFLMTSRPVGGTRNDQNNDVWIRVNEGEWRKIYTRFVHTYDEWHFSTEFDVSTGTRSPSIECDGPGYNSISLAGRSAHFRIDFIAIVGEEKAVESLDKFQQSTQTDCPNHGLAETSAPRTHTTRGPTPSPRPNQRPEPIPLPEDGTVLTASPVPTKKHRRPNQSIDSSLPSSNPDGTIFDFDPELPDDAESTPNEDEQESKSFGEDIQSLRDGSECFPSDSMVELESGRAVRMEHLQIGDRVRTPGGGYEQIYFFSHHDNIGRYQFVAITTSDGRTIRASKGHLLPTFPDGALIPASRFLEVGSRHRLMDQDGTALVVASTKLVFDRGLHNPHTASNMIVVDSISASCYTTAVPPALAHVLLAPERLAVTYLGISLYGRLFAHLDELLRQVVSRLLHFSAN